MEVPFNQGVVGHVYQTGETDNIKDVQKCSYFYRDVDQMTGFITKCVQYVCDIEHIHL